MAPEYIDKPSRDATYDGQHEALFHGMSPYTGDRGLCSYLHGHGIFKVTGKLVLQRLVPVTRGGTATSPFEKVEGFNNQWWEPGGALMRFALSKDLMSITRNSDGTEVARLKIDARRAGPYPGYGVPDSPHPFVEIVFIEVRVGHRLGGLGSNIIEMLVAEYPGTNLMAGSEADTFWEKLEWDMFLSEANPNHARKLFIRWA